MRHARQIGFGLVALVLGAAAWLWLTSGVGGADPAGEPAKPGPVAADPGEGARDPSGPPGRAERAEIAAPDGGDEPAGEGAGGQRPLRAVKPLEAIRMPPHLIPRSTRPFASAEAASDFVEDRVVELMGAVVPEADWRGMARECEPDGRTCTFVGPWPGDDFVQRWLEAISQDRTGLDELDGVRFSVLEPIVRDGEKQLRMRAHAP